MDISILGAGMMGCAITYDILKFSSFDTITLVDVNQQNLNQAKEFLSNKEIIYKKINAGNTHQIEHLFKKNDLCISALPYTYNYTLSNLAIKTSTHFLDLGGNNNIVQKQLNLTKKAEKKQSTIIPDCGLAPGLVSIITHDIVNSFDVVDSVKIRVGGLPIHPQPPFNYQIVFSAYGLINEYFEDALVLQNGKMIRKKSLTELETIRFQKPFGTLEAFVTSGGCSTLPYTYKKIIKYLDYKTIRYPGHCSKIKTLADLGLMDKKIIQVGKIKISPRDLLVALLLHHIPSKGEDVVLLRVEGIGKKRNAKHKVTYTMIDYADTIHGLSAMMRTTGFPTSIIAQMIEQGVISKRGVFCSEKIVPPQHFFGELKKRNIHIIKKSHKIHER